ncbi:protein DETOXIFICATION 44, chloroplastic isoform X3 [Citrus clementina]|uniref:protein DETOXIFICATION 44, chloroplastic isoform X3 n=1 Tax=Citrus clementina TaxID=85681 RepID=UPI000CED4581|nr:protein DETOXIFICATION 44, chloroplastic isoform X3 [Citrus x clementina]
MAGTSTNLSRHLLCSMHSSSSYYYYNSKQTKSSSTPGKFRIFNRRNLTCSARLKSAPHKKKTASTSLQTSPPDPSRFSLSGSFSLINIIARLSDGFKFDELGLEIWSIALPAALALAADPIASLIDTAFVGHLGSVELAAVGVSVSVFNLVSKLFNVPLLNITTSFVAEEQAVKSQGSDDGSSQIGNGIKLLYENQQGKKLLPSISTSLALAAGIGIAEALALSFGSGFLMNIMGIPADSPMRVPAENFLNLRAFGAPPIVIALAAQGAFRGFMDTKTPLYAIGAGNLINAILDPILIFFFHFGIGGAAIATVISEYLIAFILIWKLSDNVLLMSPDIDGRRVVHYLKSGGLLIGRTIAVLLTMTLATSMAAREGPIPMAGYQICVEVWLTLSLLSDALALAGQALLAAGYSQGNYEQARQVVFRLLQIGLVTGISLATLLFLGFGPFSHLFSTDSEVLAIAWSGLLFVAGSQPMNALAFVLDGLYYGVSDFEYAAYSMVLVGLTSSAFIFVTAPIFGLAGVWAGLFLFMTLRVLFGIWRLGTKSGPWKMVWSEMEKLDE